MRGYHVDASTILLILFCQINSRVNSNILLFSYLLKFNAIQCIRINKIYSLETHAMYDCFSKQRGKSNRIKLGTDTRV